MDARETRTPGRGTPLLAHHCAALARLDDVRPPAIDRLERVLGVDLAHLLVGALAGDHRMRPRVLAA